MTTSFDTQARQALILIQQAEHRFRAEGLRVQASTSFDIMDEPDSLRFGLTPPNHPSVAVTANVTWNNAYARMTAGGVIWGRFEVNGIPVTPTIPTEPSLAASSPAALALVLQALPTLHTKAQKALEGASMALTPALAHAQQWMDETVAEQEDVAPVEVPAGTDIEGLEALRKQAAREAGTP